MEDIKLENYGSEDIDDVLLNLGKSFAINFDEGAFKEVKTFGDICEVIQSQLSYAHVESCTKQQAFYKIRNAISQAQSIDKSIIKLHSELSDIFPVKGRRKNVMRFQNCLGIKIRMLTYPEWLTKIYVVGIILSFVAFFYDWKVAVSALIFFFSAIKISELVGKFLVVKTVEQLAEKFVINRYVDIRREKGTINQKEISEIIKDAFSSQLGLDKKYLTKDASLGLI